MTQAKTTPTQTTPDAVYAFLEEFHNGKWYSDITDRFGTGANVKGALSVLLKQERVVRHYLPSKVKACRGMRARYYAAFWLETV